jgi:hypothetical protein
MRIRRSKILLLILVMVLLLPLAFLVFERVRGQSSLARYKRQLVAEGMKLSPRDFVQPPSTGENGAPEIVAAARRLQKGLVMPMNYPPRMAVTPSGRAIVGFRENQWAQGQVTNCWEELATELETNEAELDQIRAALGKPVMDNHLDFSLGYKMLLPHLASAKSASQWFGARSQFALHQGRTHDAFEDLIAQVNLPRLSAQDHILISELVRIAMASMANTGTWEALQADGLADDDLAKLQQACENQHFAAAMMHALEGEMVFMEACFDLIRNSNSEAAQMISGPVMLQDFDSRPSLEKALRKAPWGDEIADFLRDQVYCRIWGFAWLDQADLYSLEVSRRFLEISRTAAAGKSLAAVQPAMDRLHNEWANLSFYDHLRYAVSDAPDWMSRVILRAMRAETERSMVITAIAIKRYSLRYGKPPAGLDLLVPEFVSSVPIDYMDGQPLKYHLRPEGGFTLYSVGENGKDDGGDTTLLPDQNMSQTLWNRKDFVWPSPALPEEIEAYRGRRAGTH